jgi:uncharacterized membrane protein
MVAEARSRFQPHPYRPRNPHREVAAAMSGQDRIALVITGAVGTMYAVYAFATFMAGWILLQVVLGNAAFDPYPFAFLLFIGNIVQLLLMPLIMVGQNLQARHGEARTDEEYRRVAKIFHDSEATLGHLDAQDRELLRQTKLLLGLVETLVPEADRAKLLATTPDGLDGPTASKAS